MELVNDKKITRRNEQIDLIRGIAIFLVMIGHVGDLNSTDFTSSLLGNIIWSIQMPLLMLISGYCTKYSKKVTNIESLAKHVSKKSMTYLLPWFVWTIVVRGLIINKMNILVYLEYILFNMDAGFWFLSTLWIITLIFGFASLISSILGKENILDAIQVTIFCALFGGLLLILGLVFGMDFFGIKFVVYYLPYFCIGYLFSQIGNLNFHPKYLNNLTQILLFSFLMIYFIIIYNVNLFFIEDTLTNIVFRVTASLTGCSLVIYVVNHYIENLNIKVRRVISIFGKYSLELYIIHIYFAKLVTSSPLPEFFTLQGISVFSLNFIFMLLISFICIIVIHSSKIARLVFFGKWYYVKKSDSLNIE